MKNSVAVFVLLAGNTVWLFGESGSGWKPDPEHRQLKYRVECSQGSATVDWHNGYRSEVNLRATLRSAIYEGPKQLRIAPGGSAQSHLETMDCAPIRVAVTSFSVVGAVPPRSRILTKAANPPPAKASPRKARPVKSKSRRAKTRRKQKPRTAAPVKVAKRVEPEATPEAIASTRVGMTQEQVLARLGAPAARLTMPDEDQMVQIFSYHTADDKMGAVYFTNGKVSEVRPPR